MVPAVFYSVCYGTKDVPEAIQKLHTFTPAILHGYCRRRVRYADYPGVTEDKDHKTFGIFTTGLTRANLERLDYFEGGDYERRTVSVRLLDEIGDIQGHGQVEGEERSAGVYVYLKEQDLEDREWDLEEFRREKLQSWTRQGFIFAGMCCFSLWTSVGPPLPPGNFATAQTELTGYRSPLFVP